MQQVWRPAPAAVTPRRDRRASAERRAATASACASRRPARSATSSRTAAGCRGSGRMMRWLPDYGVGIVAFGNLTYTGWGAHDRRGARRARSRPAVCSRGSRSAVARAGRGARQGRRSWSRAGTIGSPTASPRRICSSIESKDRRRAEIDALHATVGACRAGERIRHRRERAARRLDDELRAREARRSRSRSRRRCRRRCSSCRSGPHRRRRRKRRRARV